LFCARDPFGAKPLIYHAGAELFAFASEARPLLGVSGVPRALHEPRIADFLVGPLEGIDATRTFFEGIFKLAPAHRLTVRRTGGRLKTRTERYWTPNPTQELRLRDDRAYEAAFREALDGAVAVRLRSHRPVGVLQSGGIDSAAVAGVARSLLPPGGRLRTFSAARPDPDCAESRAVRTLAATEGVQAEILTPDRFAEDPGSLVDHAAGMDDPFDAYLDGFRPALYARARAAGVTALLDGVDGDVVLGTGWTFLYEWLRRGRWLRAVGEARAFSDTFDYPAHRLLWHGGVKPALAAAAPRWVLAKRRARQNRARTTGDLIRGTLLDRDFAERVDVVGRTERLAQHGASPASPSFRHRHAAALTHPYLAVALDRYERVALRHGIEARHPLLDRRLVELTLALPFGQKMRAGQRKSVLRRATADVVPEAIRSRSGLGQDLSWLYRRRHLELEWDVVADVLLSEAAAPYIDGEGVRAVLDEPASGAVSEPDVWNAAVLSAWLGTVRDDLEGPRIGG
ncbi:MAG: asparagine synthase-related protein, partial [Rhodothermales bacterium]|nr:asparagine synthase-related protein [Rhodothermales bacterium]